MVLGGVPDIQHLNFGILDTFFRSLATKLGFKLDTYLKLDAQVGAIVKAGFFQLRLLSKIKPFLSFSVFKRVVHALITMSLL